MDGAAAHSFGQRVREVREELKLSMEELAERAGLHRTAIGLLERGEREPALGTAIAIARALKVPVQELLASRPRRHASGRVLFEPTIPGIDGKSILRAIEATYAILDTIDHELSARGSQRLAEAMELANLSTFIGNLFASALAKESGGTWIRNGPHKYPDLIPPTARPVKARGSAPISGVEVKVAMETKAPKGHLPKEGTFITLRYVLSHSDGRAWKRKERGDMVVIWEARVGTLRAEDYRISNTEGDSGKTAVISAGAQRRMQIAYFDEKYCPFASVERYLKVVVEPSEGQRRLS